VFSHYYSQLESGATGIIAESDIAPLEKPTRLEALRYYRRVAEMFDLPITFGETVLSLTTDAATRELVVRTRGTKGEQDRRARAVVFAVGYYDHPNHLNIPGEDLPHVSHYYNEAHSSYRQRVVIVGGKNSAAEAALELHRSGAKVTMVHRRATLGASIKYWVKPDIENRIAEGSIAARFESKVVEITPDAVVIEHRGRKESLPADRVFLMTGYHADFDLLKACGLEIDPATNVPMHDASTLESSSVSNVFFAGGVLAGKDTAPIFIEKIFEIIIEINKQGTPILLVEQNALMALEVAQRGYVLETGKVALADDAKALRENEDVRKTYLGEE